MNSFVVFHRLNTIEAYQSVFNVRIGGIRKLQLASISMQFLVNVCKQYQVPYDGMKLIANSSGCNWYSL